MQIFNYKDYKQYLSDFIEQSQARGIKAQLADAAGCQRSFFSQVINSHVHLTLDHAIGIAKYLRLNSNELEYFYNLVGHARAATPLLQKRYLTKLKLIKKDEEHLATKFKSEEPEANISEYYSSWKFSAIHILCTIPEFQTEHAIAKKLRLDLLETKYILAKLNKMNLIEKRKDKWNTTDKNIHLSKDHFMNHTNHRNWRDKNLELATENPENSINYTATYSMSKKDFEQLKSLTFDFLERSRAIVAPSKEEELVSFSLDCSLFPNN